jgi:hypothetical protein
MFPVGHPTLYRTGFPYAFDPPSFPLKCRKNSLATSGTGSS